MYFLVSDIFIKCKTLPQPELQVEVSVTNPLVSADVYAVSNHMTIRVDSVYSLPDTWQPSNNAVSSKQLSNNDVSSKQLTEDDVSS